MSAEEGRDYHLVWDGPCSDGGEHDVYELTEVSSYVPVRAGCHRCGQRARVLAEPHAS